MDPVTEQWWWSFALSRKKFTEVLRGISFPQIFLSLEVYRHCRVKASSCAAFLFPLIVL